MSEAAKKLLFVGIDTSNYTTSCALCDGEGKVIANIKKMLPVKEGERGLRQSDALFAHTKNLPECMDKLGEFAADKLGRFGKEDNFAKGFVSCSILFCVGAMTVNGATVLVYSMG